MVWTLSGLVSIKDMEKAIKIAKKRNDSHIGVEDGRLWSGGISGDYFHKTTINEI